MLVIFSVIPSLLILQLSQNLNWWLRLKENFRHVKIINENDTFHSKPWTEVIFSSFIEFHINDILNLVAVSLSGETYFND
jgi:hypothetical protein